MDCGSGGVAADQLSKRKSEQTVFLCSGLSALLYIHFQNLGTEFHAAKAIKRQRSFRVPLLPRKSKPAFIQISFFGKTIIFPYFDFSLQLFLSFSFFSRSNRIRIKSKLFNLFHLPPAQQPFPCKKLFYPLLFFPPAPCHKSLSLLSSSVPTDRKARRQKVVRALFFLYSSTRDSFPYIERRRTTLTGNGKQLHFRIIFFISFSFSLLQRGGEGEEMRIHTASLLFLLLPPPKGREEGNEHPWKHAAEWVGLRIVHFAQKWKQAT